MPMHIRNQDYRYMMALKPNVVGAAVLIALTRETLGRPLTATEMQRASGFSHPGWKDNREAVLTCLEHCFSIARPEEEAA